MNDSVGYGGRTSAQAAMSSRQETTVPNTSRGSG